MRKNEIKSDEQESLAASLAWDMFERTGSPGMYMLYNSLKSDEKNNPPDSFF